jgi:hypothetical protein
MHRTSTFAALCLTVIASGGVYAGEEVGWRDAQGNPVPQSDSMKSSKGFGGQVILVSDPDWEAKWARPETPHFTTTESLTIGESFVALVLFTNPATDARGNIHIVCDYRVVRPDGSLSQEVKAATCGEGPLEGDPHNVRLVSHLIGFTGEATDVEGEWVITVRLTDAVRKTSLDLKTGFEYHVKPATGKAATN